MSARKAVLRTVSAGPDKEDSAVDLTFPVQSVETKMHGPYKRGDRLLYEKPWIFVVSEKCRERICNHCFESLHSSTGASLPCQPEILVRVSRTMKPGLRRCTGCAFSWYCGKDCQKTSWKFVHKHECQFFKKALETEETAIPLTVETVRLCLQAMIRMKNDPDWDRPADGFPELSHRTFPNIMSHWKEIREDQKELDFIDLMSSYFQKIWKGQDLYSDLIEPSVLGVIYGKVRINNMTIFGTYGDKLGVGLYLSASAIDHACLPNACPSFSGIRINIHATEDVDCFDNVRLSYLDQTYFSRPRREMLRQRYYFDCFCRGCADDRLDRKMNAVRCTKPSCKGHVLMDPYTFDSDPCSVCQEMPDDISKESIKRALQNGIEAQALVAEAKKSDEHRKVLHESEELYLILRKVMHPTNTLLISTSLQVATSADILGQYDKAFFHFMQLAIVYPQVFSRWCFQYSEILMKCTTRGLLVQQSPLQHRNLLVHFIEAMKIVSTCAGRDSPTFAYYKKFYDDCRQT
ncbi:histone-lysine N-methyltransferase set-18-like isoform X2 [Paramacrobiotus metropolitanus]|uniref:histone-lysine N-methyltransferase set-18-like isoform X2 n=1 Tax=Paramacrobiotus metropolitanus TaxID=2943436 RepID=UPI002445F747|nr:histone-lysine N-methyltransferase set-18-like isoform X2 [Paramacrobiotus metropolitanus]